MKICEIQWTYWRKVLLVCLKYPINNTLCVNFQAFSQNYSPYFTRWLNQNLLQGEEKISNHKQPKTKHLCKWLQAYHKRHFCILKGLFTVFILVKYSLEGVSKTRCNIHLHVSAKFLNILEAKLKHAENDSLWYQKTYCRK